MDGLVGFFAPEPVLWRSGDKGFSVLGPEHLAMLGCLTLTGVLLARRYMRQDARGRRRQLVAMCAVPVALLVSRDLQDVAAGVFWPQFWPLHICNMCEFLGLAWAITGWCPLADVYYPWATVGAIGALLFPGWAYYCPIISYASLGGFLEHALMATTCWCMMVGGEYVPERRRLWLPGVAAVAGGLVFRRANPVMGTNFFFVSEPSAGSPMVWLADVFGDPGWLVAYLAAAVAVWCGFVALGRHFSPRVEG